MDLLCSNVESIRRRYTKGANEMTNEEIDKLATSITQKLAGQLYTLPEEFKDNLYDYSTDYLLPPLSIPMKTHGYYFTLSIKVKSETRGFDIILYDLNGEIMKRFEFL